VVRRLGILFGIAFLFGGILGFVPGVIKETQRGCRDIELFGSLSNNMSMGRPKNFSREGVLEKVMLAFWKYGFP
jgi:hypothetical protein